MASQTTLYTQFGLGHRPLCILSLDDHTDHSVYTVWIGPQTTLYTKFELPHRQLYLVSLDDNREHLVRMNGLTDHSV